MRRTLPWSTVRSPAFSSCERAPQAQTRHAAIRNDVKAHVRDRTERGDFAFEVMLLVHLQLLFAEQDRPEHRLRDERAVRAARHVRGLNRAAVGVIALEVGRIHFDFPDHARLRQRDDRPVVARFAAAARFPAVAHVHATARHQNRRGRAEMLVVRRDQIRAVFHLGHIELLGAARPPPRPVLRCKVVDRRISICFDLSVFELFLPLSVGGTVVLAEDALQLGSGGWSEELSLINTVPSAMAELVRLECLPRSVRVVNLAGEPLPQRLVGGVDEGGVERVYDLYGPTEATTYSTYALRGAGERATIGRPIANTQ